MIQRIQSVYLFFTSLLSLLYLKGGFISYSDETGAVIKFTLAGIYDSSELLLKTFTVTILIILIPLLAAFILFLFKKRNIQLILCKVMLFILSAFVISLVVYSYIIIGKYNATIVPGIKMGIPIIQLILGYLAYRGIKKDDDLVKSYDRLR